MRTAVMTETPQFLLLLIEQMILPRLFLDAAFIELDLCPQFLTLKIEAHAERDRNGEDHSG